MFQPKCFFNQNVFSANFFPIVFSSGLFLGTFLTSHPIYPDRINIGSHTYDKISLMHTSKTFLIPHPSQMALQVEILVSNVPSSLIMIMYKYIHFYTLANDKLRNIYPHGICNIHYFIFSPLTYYILHVFPSRQLHLKLT